MFRSIVLPLALLSAPAAASYYQAEPATAPHQARFVARDNVWQCAGTQCASGRTSTRPAIVCATLVREVGALRSFDLISVMSGGGPFDSSTVLAYFMYDQAIKYYREGYSAAIAVVLFAIMLVYIAWQLRRLVRTDS